MPGRHASSDTRRFRRDLIRLIVIALSLVVVGAALVVSVRLVTGGAADGEPAPVAEGGSTSTSIPPPTTPATAATTPPSTGRAAPSTTQSIPSTTTTAPPSTTSTLAPVRRPDQITVQVLNSTGVTGLAGRITERLSALGYRTESPANHRPRLDTSVVWYLEGFDREAEILAEEIPDANLEPFPGEEPRAHLTVVVGASYRE